MANKHQVDQLGSIPPPPVSWKAVQLRGNLLPTKSGLHNRSEDRFCRFRCRRVESLFHVLQGCPAIYGPRINRHDHIVNQIGKMARKEGWNVEVYIGKDRSGWSSYTKTKQQPTATNHSSQPSRTVTPISHLCQGLHPSREGRMVRKEQGAGGTTSDRVQRLMFPNMRCNKGYHILTRAVCTPCMGETSSGSRKKIMILINIVNCSHFCYRIIEIILQKHL